MERACAACGKSIEHRRADATTCGQRCRKAASRSAGVPVELTSRPRWVRWSARKVPLTVEGRAASSTDPSTWSTHEAVAGSGAGIGAGFVLDGDGVYCLDLDDCLVDGVLSEQARAVMAMVPRTYVEVSPSGSGLHVWLLGDPGPGAVHRMSGVELYSTRRYITVTGREFAGSVSRLARFDWPVSPAA
jgi:primase-polymerase (primpol)-like protein